jgi:hypothetical protein
LQDAKVLLSISGMRKRMLGELIIVVLIVLAGCAQPDNPAKPWDECGLLQRTEVAQVARWESAFVTFREARPRAGGWTLVCGYSKDPWVGRSSARVRVAIPGDILLQPGPRGESPVPVPGLGDQAWSYLTEAVQLEDRSEGSRATTNVRIGNAALTVELDLPPGVRPDAHATAELARAAASRLPSAPSIRPVRADRPCTLVSREHAEAVLSERLPALRSVRTGTAQHVETGCFFAGQTITLRLIASHSPEAKAVFARLKPTGRPIAGVGDEAFATGSLPLSFVMVRSGDMVIRIEGGYPRGAYKYPKPEVQRSDVAFLREVVRALTRI